MAETAIKMKEGKNIIKLDNGRVRVVTHNSKPSLTKQEFKDDVNVNKIIQKYSRTGMLTHVRNNPGAYMDISNVGDYQEAITTITQAHTLFDSLPSEIRKEFQNDPQQLINFMSDPRNRDRAEELGLVLPNKTVDEPLGKVIAKQPVKDPQKLDKAPKKADPTPSSTQE